MSLFPLVLELATVSESCVLNDQLASVRPPFLSWFLERVLVRSCAVLVSRALGRTQTGAGDASLLGQTEPVRAQASGVRSYVVFERVPLSPSLALSTSAGSGRWLSTEQTSFHVGVGLL